jgi:phospholipase/carboxylesterase
VTEEPRPQEGRLSFRPSPLRAGPSPEIAPGLRELGLGASRDGLLYVPRRPGGGPLPLAVSFHGAGGSGSSALARVREASDEMGFAVLAPDSRGPTWDVIGGGFGPDLLFIDRALERVFTTPDIDPSHVVAHGFSDGASYALSLGITNGDLFRTILALSPGFIAAGGAAGRPRVWISHGTEDTVLPPDSTSRRLAPALERSGFHLRYTEFEGGHETPKWLTTAAFRWWLEDDLAEA